LNGVLNLELKVTHKNTISKTASIHTYPSISFEKRLIITYFTTLTHSLMKRLSLIGILVLLGVLLFTNPNLKEIAAGIAILLFGMIMLEEGFNSFISAPLQKLLQRTTDRLHKTLALGFASTAILQSSSLISVIAISFISSGLISLKAGIGIIFGSNLGTTATAWLVATLGLKVDVSQLAMPMLAFGIVLVLQRSKQVKGLGQVLAGLGFFFMGIYFMKSGFEVYKESFDLAAFHIEGVRGVIVFSFIGIVLTAILQSSSATMALILTALALDQISYTNSLALAIGANIGTTVTSMIGSISSNTAGKRLAGAHFIFNVITGFIALIFINFLAQFVDFTSEMTGVASDNYTIKLAIFHSVFNALGVIIMIPLINPLIRFLERIFKTTEKPQNIEQPHFINDNALAYPQTALRSVHNETKRLFEHSVVEIITHGLNLHRSDIKGPKKIKEIVKESKVPLEINIEDLYLRKVKTIYSKIIEFVTIAQSKFYLTPGLTTQFAQLKLANRNIVESIKLLENIRKNMVKYLNADNPHIQKEYDKLRRKVSKVLREIHELKQSQTPEVHAEKLNEIKIKTTKSDILIDGTLDQLIRDDKISSTMASSLANDSRSVSIIIENLIETSELIYLNSDTLMEESVTEKV
jgi:phosphate:Na+ symporter